MHLKKKKTSRVTGTKISHSSETSHLGKMS